MGYLQTTNGVSSVGPGPTLTFTTPICAQVSLQITGPGGSGSIDVGLEGSLDGIVFFQLVSANASFGGNAFKSNAQSFSPIAAIRYNVTSIAGTFSISIAAAPSGSE